MSAVAPRRGGAYRIVRAVLGSELRQLVRDRRALFSAVLLPALLYPLMFLSQDKLEELSRDTLAAREVSIALDLARADGSIAQRFRDLLLQRTPIALFDVDAEPLTLLAEVIPKDPELDRERIRDTVVELIGGSGHLLVTAEPDEVVRTRTSFHLYFDVKDDSAREAKERAESAIAELEDELAETLRTELLGTDPARGLHITSVDVASAEDASGAALGKLLPLIAILILMTGGSYAALAIFAGERESGTLETLLVQPVLAEHIAWGKFLAVLATALVTLAVNFASMFFCLAQGLGQLPNLEGSGGVSALRILSGFVYLPGAVLLCAVLCLVCGRARTFREGQMTIFPVMLAALVPTSIAMIPSVEMDVLLAMVPMAGPALALRDALRGDLRLIPLLAMILSHVGWAWLALSHVANILDAEKILGTKDTEAELAQRHTVSRHAIRWGFIAVLVNYILGSMLTGWRFELGTVLVFWVMVPALIVLVATGTARRTKEPWVRELGIAMPRWRYVIGAMLLAPGLARLALWFLPLQQELLPMPEGALEGSELIAGIAALGTWKLLFLLALSPGIMEELLFRGALMSGMKRDLSPAKTVLWQAFLFAAIHASIYRIVPTFSLGALFAVIALRSRSVIPAIIVHVGYDAIMVLAATGRLEWLGSAPSGHLAWLILPGLALCVLPAGAAESQARDVRPSPLDSPT